MFILRTDSVGIRQILFARPLIFFHVFILVHIFPLSNVLSLEFTKIYDGIRV